VFFPNPNALATIIKDGVRTLKLCCYKILKLVLQCFDAVGWAAGRASGL